MNTLYMLCQVRRSPEQFITNVAFQSLFPLTLGPEEVGVDEVDVVVEVGGVRADPPAGGAADPRPVLLRGGPRGGHGGGGGGGDGGGGGLLYDWHHLNMSCKDHS